MKPSKPDNFAIFTSETVLGIYRSATSGIFAVLIGVVALSLVVAGEKGHKFMDWVRARPMKDGKEPGAIHHPERNPERENRLRERREHRREH